MEECTKTNYDIEKDLKKRISELEDKILEKIKKNEDFLELRLERDSCSIQLAVMHDKTRRAKIKKNKNYQRKSDEPMDYNISIARTPMRFEN